MASDDTKQISDLDSAGVYFMTVEEFEERAPKPGSGSPTRLPLVGTARETTMAETSEPTLGPIATRILHEDERVRIWEQEILPGAATEAHFNEHDYALIELAAADLEVEPVAGLPNPHFEKGFALPAKRGNVYFVPKGSNEIARNTGDTPYRAILVEFKEPA